MNVALGQAPPDAVAGRNPPCHAVFLRARAANPPGMTGFRQQRTQRMTEFKHGGHIRKLAQDAGIREDQVLDFSANMNPLGPPEWLRAVVCSSLSSVAHYPDPDCHDLKSCLATRYGADVSEVLVGNGSTELIHLLPRALPIRRAVVPVPSYSDYCASAESAGLQVERFPLHEADGFVIGYEALEACLLGDELVFLGHPNNPTGVLLDCRAVRALAAEHPSSVFVIDEAFLDLTDNGESFTARRPPNMVVIVSLTKTYAIPGLRLGCAVAHRETVRRVEAIQPPWSVNRIAQAVGIAALEDPEYLQRSREVVRRERQFLSQQLGAIPGLEVYPGTANFLLVRIGRHGLDAHDLAKRLLAYRIAIRVCENFDGLDSRFFRVAVRNRDDNLLLCEALEQIFQVSAKPRPRSRRHAIMFQGTSSNAGKSVLTAALCRILLQDGYRVAPFKTQNMSLNSFVTRAGGEMGRAQVVQAQACRLDPDVRMNPILLKPNSDTGSQVIVNGLPVGNMDVLEYVNYKPVAFAAARKAFDSLASEFDVIVIEGAGSPAEVNLKHHDIVNMETAKYAAAPVLIVGDIDRGGVFASFVGTMEVLAEWERALVAGFVVNKFRGRADILDPAFRYIERHTGRPILGLVPYIKDLGLPEEDSVTFKSALFQDSVSQEEYVEIAAIDLPHISNFTDLDPLRLEPDVRLRIVRSTDDLNQPDAIILPGSKNVAGDLAYLAEKGLGMRIADLARMGRTELVGICGGFQMLGETVEDPHHIESQAGSIKGLGLLDISTVMELEKTLTRVSGMHLESGRTVRGYEIHHGQTESQRLRPVVRLDCGEFAGAASHDGMVWGTYMHGIFDADEFRRWFLDRLRARKGLAPVAKIRARYDLEPAFDGLAEAVRQGLRMPEIYRLMGL